MSNLTPSEENKLTGCLALNGPIECFGPELAACTLLNSSVLHHLLGGLNVQFMLRMA